MTLSGRFSAGSCVITDTMTITNNALDSLTIDTTLICGQTITVGTSIYNSSGSYVDTLSNANSCDSIVTLNLTVTACEHDTIYFDVEVNDSITVCDTMFENGVMSADNGSLCVGGTTGTNGSGSYEVAPNGCITFTANTTTGDFVDTICVVTYDSTVMTWDTTYFIPSIYCDTTLVTIDTTVICGQTFTVGTSTYNSTGTYVDTLTAANSCDSIITLNLTVTACEHDTIYFDVEVNDSITVCDTMFENGVMSADNGFLM